MPHLAPCGHEGEPIFGTFVLCRRPECQGGSKPAGDGPVFETSAPKGNTATVRFGPNNVPGVMRFRLGPADRAWAEAEAKAVSIAAVNGVLARPGRDIIPVTNATPGAQVFTYLSGSARQNLLLQTSGLQAAWSETQIAAALLAKRSLSSASHTSAAQSVREAADTRALWSPTSTGGFFDHPSVTNRWRARCIWKSAFPDDIASDLLVRVSYHMRRARTRKVPVCVALPYWAYDRVATARVSSGDTIEGWVRDKCLRHSGVRFEMRRGPGLVSLDRAVAFVMSPSVVEQIIAIPCEALAPQWITDANGVESLSVTYVSQAAEGCALYSPNEVSYWGPLS